jgi:hypothetical protein
MSDVDTSGLRDGLAKAKAVQFDDDTLTIRIATWNLLPAQLRRTRNGVREVYFGGEWKAVVLKD